MITVIHNYTILQEKSKSKYGHAERLQILRLKKQLSWEQLAELLGLSVAMLYHVKRGVRNLSEKAVYRLEQAEVTAGLRPPATSETLSLKQENSDLEKGVKQFRTKLAALDPKSQKRMLKVILQILDAQRKALSK